MGSTCSRARLALILGPELRRSIGELRGGSHPIEADLPDLHAGVDGDGQRGNVGELQGDVAFESGVDESGRGVDE